MKKKYFFILSVLSLLLSCNTRDKVDNVPEEDDIKILTIVPQKGTATNYSQFIDSIKYIPLETPDNVMLSSTIPKVIYAKNRYFVFDKKKVVVFDSHGKYILKVGKKGRGPQEIISPTDFIVDTLSNTIEISSLDGKVIIYDLYYGNFIDVLRINGISINKLCKPDTDKYVLYGKNINSMEDNAETIDNLFFYNSTNSSVVKSTLTIPYYLARFNGESANSFSAVKGGVLFLRLLDNNVYLIDNADQVRIRYKIDYGDHNIPNDEKFLEKYKYLGDIIQNTNYVVQFTGLFASNSHLYFLYFIHNQNYIAIYDRIHDKILYGNQFKGIRNDVDFGPIMFPDGIFDNCLISTIEPIYFIDHFNKIRKDMGEKKWNKYLSNHPNIKNILDSVEPENNSIIGLYFLKGNFLDEKDDF